MSEQYEGQTAAPQQQTQADQMVTISQAELNKLIGGARTKGFERGVQQAAYQPPDNLDYAQAPAGYQQPARKALTEDAAIDLVNRKVEEFERKRQEEQARAQADYDAKETEKFINQVNNILTQQAYSPEYKERLDEIVTKMASENNFNDSVLFPIKAISTEFDNGIEILLYLADNPSACSNIANQHKYEWKKKSLEKISKQLKAEKDAKKSTPANLPGGNLRSSPNLSTSGSKNGAGNSWSSVRGKYNS